MAQEPDRIKEDIDATRSELARDVDALADRTLPNRVARRRWASVKEKVRSVSDKVMGAPAGATHTAADGLHTAMDRVQHSASEAGEKVADMAGTVATTVRQAPGAVAHGAQGNPVAAGMIAFGVGLLAASMIPTTDLEREAGQRIKDNAGGLLDEVRQPLTESAEQIKEDVVGAATVALDEIKQTAKEAARTTKDDAATAAQQAVEDAKAAARSAR